MLSCLFKLEIKTSSRLNLIYGNVWNVAYVSLVGVFLFCFVFGGGYFADWAKNISTIM